MTDTTRFTQKPPLGRIVPWLNVSTCFGAFFVNNSLSQLNDHLDSSRMLNSSALNPFLRYPWLDNRGDKTVTRAMRTRCVELTAGEECPVPMDLTVGGHVCGSDTFGFPFSSTLHKCDDPRPGSIVDFANMFMPLGIYWHFVLFYPQIVSFLTKTPRCWRIDYDRLSWCSGLCLLTNSIKHKMLGDVSHAKCWAE